MSDNGKITVEFDVHFATKQRGRKRAEVGQRPAELDASAGALPRVTRLMALAIRFDQLIREGEVAGYSELARLGHVTRARITQIMNLLHLAPDIQETLLSLPRTTGGRDPITERDLRPIAAIIDWRTQRRIWRRLIDQSYTPSPPQNHRTSADGHRAI